MAEKPDSSDPFHHIFGRSEHPGSDDEKTRDPRRDLTRKERRAAAERDAAAREEQAAAEADAAREQNRLRDAERQRTADELRARSRSDRDAVEQRIEERSSRADANAGPHVAGDRASRRAQAEARRARLSAEEAAAAANAPVSAREAAARGHDGALTQEDTPTSERDHTRAPAGPGASDRVAPPSQRSDRDRGTAETRGAAETSAAAGAAAHTTRAESPAPGEPSASTSATSTPAASEAATSTPAASEAATSTPAASGAAAGPASTPSTTRDPHDPADAEWLRVITGAVDTTAHGDDAASGDSAGASGSRADRRRSTHVGYPTPEKKSRKGVIAGVVIVVVLALLAGAVVYTWNAVVPGITSIFSSNEPEDYEGSGSGEVLVTIISGDTGSDIAKTLKDNGVIASQDAFYQLLLAQADAPVFQPGTYALAEKMSAKAALDRLLDPASKQANGFVIPEGTAMKDAFDLISAGTGVSVDDLNAAAADLASFGLPAEAKSLEGFLFPATYDFEPNTSAHDILKRLVDRMYQALDSAGVAPENRWNTIVLAALVQREAGLRDDYPKVARVFLNRTDPTLWPSGLLQSDATVAYGTGNTHLVTTTDAERADASNPYNTYVHPGMVVGPISNPGDLAIDAAVNPAEGSWLYFVTWNLETGETIFSNTLEEHEAGVRKWQQWMRDNPNYG